ncbi:MAG: hypothetical protein ACOCXT_02985, partial [Candidatus Dojkabacteria bacterium]
MTHKNIWIPMGKYSNIIQKTFKILLLLLIISVVSLPSFSPINPVLAEKSSEEKELEAKKKALEEELKSIENSLDAEKANQKKYENDAAYLESIITQNESKVKRLKLEIEKKEVEVEEIALEKEDIQQRLGEIEDQKNTVSKEQDLAANKLFKMLYGSGSLLDESSTYEDSVINEEKQRYLAKLIKSHHEELKELEKETRDKKAEIEEKEKKSRELAKSMEVESQNLAMQEEGLEYQKGNKLSLIEKSKSSEEALSDNMNVVNSDLEDVKQQIQEYYANLEKEKRDAYNTPPSCNRVSAGQVIGFQGRTGLSCSPYDGSVPRTNNYCQVYAGLASNWYYYDASQFPTKGSHLHFEYFKNGAQVYPYNYIFKKDNSEFAHMPMSPVGMSQGYHFGGA